MTVRWRPVTDDARELKMTPSEKEYFVKTMRRAGFIVNQAVRVSSDRDQVLLGMSAAWGVTLGVKANNPFDQILIHLRDYDEIDIIGLE